MLQRKKILMLLTINLAILFKFIFIEKYDFGNRLAPLVDDIKKFELEGITLQGDNHRITFRGTILLVAADNLAEHQLRGYCGSFCHTCRLCRYFMYHQNDLQNCLNDVSAQKRKK